MRIKKSYGIFCIMLALSILVTSCGKIKESGEPPVNSSLGDNKNTPMGKFLQTDCTPPDVSNGKPLSFSQKESGEILLSVFDSKAEIVRAFSYMHDNWSEKDNKPVKDFIAGKTMSKLSGLCDYSDNWWVDFLTEDKKLKVYKLTKTGEAQEIEIPFLKDAEREGSEIFISNRQTDDNGNICLSVADLNNSVRWIIIDGNTGKVIQTIKPSVPDYNPFFKGDKLYAFDGVSKKENIYNSLTGEIISSHSVPIEGSIYCFAIDSNPIDSNAIDSNPQMIYANSKGIHAVIPDGNLVQTIIDDQRFAYADPNVSEVRFILKDSKNGNYFLACIANDKTLIYKYSFDKELPTNPTKKLSVWALKDNAVARAAASIFSKEYSECEVNLEFGKTSEDDSLTQEDIIRNLNTRLLAGDAPDVLFLDGLSIETLSSKGLLSELNIDFNKTEYYENIINGYQRNGKKYAYPAFFSMPVLVGTETTQELTKKNTLQEIANFYKNDKLIFNNSYKDVFEAFFYSSYSKLFPDNKSVDEAAIKEFLTATKSIIDSQKITSEASAWGDIGITGGKGDEMVTLNFAPSLMQFGKGETRYATGIIKLASDGNMLFRKQKQVSIIPLLDGSYIGRHIASVPANAKNKEMAQNYIRILLSDDSVQSNNIVGGYAVKKSMGMKKYNDEIAKTHKEQEEPPYLSDPAKFDWDGFIGKYNKPCTSETELYNIVYEQAKDLYVKNINIDTATAEIMKKLKLFLAEKN